MKRFFLGTVLLALGTIWTLALTVLSVVYPWEYNDTGGLLGFLLATKTHFVFVLALAVSIAGLCICIYEAYIKK